MIRNDILAQIAVYLPNPSLIGSHDQVCCWDALAWLRGSDASNSYRGGQWYPPTWLRKKFEWGPHPWPLYWCSLPNMKALDCGGLAAVATHLTHMRGQSATSVQLVLRYPSYAAEQWLQMWKRKSLSTSWIANGLCYHEACGVLQGDHIFLWDPTENRWLDPPMSASDVFASVMAIKVPRLGSGSCSLYWGDIPIHCGIWHSFVFNARGDIIPQQHDL